MKIQITGTYRKANSHWVVELPSLNIKVEGKSPFQAFRALEELIQKEIGNSTECLFRIHDDGHFELNTSKTPELVSFIARKIYENAGSSEEIGKILSQIKFNGDLEER